MMDGAVATPTLSKQRLRLWLRLLRAVRETEGALRVRLKDHGSTLPRFDVMAALARRPEGAAMGELSRMLRVSGGNVTALVDRLEADGLAERRAVPGDRRSSLVALTPAGADAFAAMAEAHEGWIDAAFSSLDAEDL
ncbi:MAG: MarR family transcriptional regulator, partial [Pseudomonadota bacterium]